MHTSHLHTYITFTYIHHIYIHTSHLYTSIHPFIQRAYVRHAQHEARHATVPTQVCVAAVSQTLSVGQKFRTGCVPSLPSSAVLHPRYGMEATPSVSFPQAGFLQLSSGFLYHCVSHWWSMSRKTRASSKPGDAGHRDVSIRYVCGLHRWLRV